MDLKINDNTSFNARLSVPKCFRTEQALIKPAQPLFEEMTKDKPGRMRIIPGYLDDNPNVADSYIFSLGKGSTHRTAERLQSAHASESWFHNLLNKSPKEQAEAFVKIFDTLNLIPAKIGKRSRIDESYMSSLRKTIQESLGNNEYQLSEMFNHIG